MSALSELLPVELTGSKPGTLCCNCRLIDRELPAAAHETCVRGRFSCGRLGRH